MASLIKNDFYEYFPFLLPKISWGFLSPKGLEDKQNISLFSSIVLHFFAVYRAKLFFSYPKLTLHSTTSV